MQLAIQREVLAESVEWIKQSPRHEVGGKYVGRIHGDFDAAAHDWWEQLAHLRIEVVHHLDCGPLAERSPTFHRPDGRYQEMLFRAVEARFPDVRHLGSWHSHHPNGMGMLSQGDVHGYLQDVNSPHHSHDLFVASLATDRRGLSAARHFLFVRGHDTLLEIDPSCVAVLPGSNEYHAVIDDFRQRTATALDRTGRADIATTGYAGLIIALQAIQRWWEFLIDQLRWILGMNSDTPTATTAAQQPVTLPQWTTTEAGKNALASDRAWMRDEHRELNLVIRGGVLLWTGVVKHGEVLLKVTIAYPDDYPTGPPTIDVQGSYRDVETETRAVLRRDSNNTYRRHLFLLLGRCADALLRIAGDEPYNLGSAAVAEPRRPPRGGR